ncbi:MAG: hypothetical protein JXA46_15435 [Dehalococcoidales bacterium]|nr:hypothetical protein [Dehalococcoidales bacterium]
MNTGILAENRQQTLRGTAGYFIFMAVAVLCLYAVNNLSYHQFQPIDPSVSSYYPGWVVAAADKLSVMQVPFANRYFISCLWAINLFLSSCIMGNFVLLLYRPRWFHHLVMLVISALALLAVYVIYHIFPFELPDESSRTAARIILWVMIAIPAAGMLWRLYLMVRALGEIERRRPPLLLLPWPDMDVPQAMPPGSACTDLSEQPGADHSHAGEPDSSISPELPPETPEEKHPGTEQPPSGTPGTPSSAKTEEDTPRNN